MEQRQYGLDILRLLAMVMITALHINDEFIVSGNRALWMTGHFIEYLCYAGVNCFALLSGFLLSSSGSRYDRQWLKRITSLWLKMTLWAVVMYLLCQSAFRHGNAPFNWRDFAVNLFPLTANWWYINAYMGMLLFLPLLVKAIENMNSRELLWGCAAMLTAFSVIPLLSGSEGSLQLNNGYSAIWLMICFFYGAALKRFLPQLHKVRHIKLIAPAAAVLCALIPYWLFIRGIPVGTVLLNYLSPLCVLEAAALLVSCTLIEVRNSKIQKAVSFLSRHSLGIYLFQTYPHIFSVWVAAHPAARLPGAEIIRRFPLILLLLITIGILFDLLISTVLLLGKRKTV